MTFEIDLSQLSRSCIGEIAKQSQSASELDLIARYAIENNDVVEVKGPFQDESDMYLDEVLKNEHLSDDTVNMLIKYHKSADLHMGIIQERKMSPSQIDLMIKNLTDLSMVTFMRKQQSMELSEEQYELLANRIMSGEIHLRDCYDYFYKWEEESVTEEILTISENCSNPIKKKLRDWWQNDMRNALYEYEVCFSLRNCLTNQVYPGFDTSDMTEETADNIAGCIMHGFFQLEKCYDSNSDNYKERSIDDTVLAIIKKCSSDYSLRFRIWRSDRKKEARRANVKRND